jgi:hypothetical protein
MHTKVIFQNTRLLVREHSEYYISKTVKLLAVEDSIKSLIIGLYVNLTAKYNIKNHLVVDIYNFDEENFDCNVYTFPATIEFELYAKPKNLDNWKEIATEVILSIDNLSEKDINIQEELNNINFYEE